MLVVYGSSLCPDCIECKQVYDANNVAYEFHDITSAMKELKAFLAIRDTQASFEGVRSRHSVGIPCVLDTDGTYTLDWEKFLPSDAKREKNTTAQSCSLNGDKNC
ncbi:MAG: hypothetical protein K6E51_09240 [Treponema sp.]|nr:hypothetical protein [Treponema sp.]